MIKGEEIAPENIKRFSGVEHVKYRAIVFFTRITNTTHALSLNENYEVREYAKKRKDSVKLLNLIIEDAVMIPTKLLIFL